MVKLPSAQIPTRSVRAARLRSTCNGDGLVVVHTQDGPDYGACLGCRNCTTPAEAPSQHVPSDARRASALSMAFAATDDEEW